MKPVHPAFKEITSRHWSSILWVLSPLSFINELILGNRIPVRWFWKRDPRSGVVSREGSIPCPHCHTEHNALTWSARNKTSIRNWFGLYCPACGNIIPCLMSLSSYVILMVTFPLWFPFKKQLKKAWLKKQPARYQNLNLDFKPIPLEGYGWISVGLGWGAFMAVFMLLFKIADNDFDSTWYKVAVHIIWWLIAGLGYGYMMKLFYKRDSKISPRGERVT